MQCNCSGDSQSTFEKPPGRGDRVQTGELPSETLARPPGREAAGAHLVGDRKPSAGWFQVRRELMLQRDALGC